MRITYILCCCLASVMLLSACDGSSGSRGRSASATPGDPAQPGDSQKPATPSTPSSPLTGYLVDAAVTGVTYSSPSHSGVTGPEGDFEYTEGETVRFSIGDTELGAAIAAEQVTPFELADSPVVSGTPDIKQALNLAWSPFHAVANIALLLQSLDQDGDPANGIAITAETHTLLQGLELDVMQNWQAFAADQELQQVLDQATQRGLIAGPVQGVLPAAALQHLYRELGLGDSTQAVSLVQQTGREATGYQYDSDGYLVRVARPQWYNTGDEVSQYLTQDYSYDERGRITRFEERQYSAQEIDFFGNDSVLRSLSIYVETRDYNAAGAVTRVKRQKGGYDADIFPADEAGPAEDIALEPLAVWLYEYDADNRMQRVDYHFGLERGESDAAAVFQYDEQGRLVVVNITGKRVLSVVEELDLPDIRMPLLRKPRLATYKIAFEYDAAGVLAKDIRDGEVEGEEHSIETRHYDSEGRIARLEARKTFYGAESGRVLKVRTIREYEHDEQDNLVSERIDYRGDGTVNKVDSWQYQYDEQGRMLRRELDLDSDGALDQVTAWTFDGRGQMVSREEDLDADGLPEKTLIREFDEDGYLLSENNDGETMNYQYAPAGWGHIFAEAPRRNPLRRQD